MYKFVDGRGTGKTRKLVEKAHYSGGTVVCKNTNRMQDKVRAYGFNDITIISYDEYIELIKNNSIKDNYYIDEVETLLKMLGVSGITLIPDEE